jgi:hypothetical protein
MPGTVLIIDDAPEVTEMLKNILWVSGPRDE